MTAGPVDLRHLLEARPELGGDLLDRVASMSIGCGWSRMRRSSVTDGAGSRARRSSRREPDRRARSTACRRSSPCSRRAAEPETAGRPPDGAAVEDAERQQVEQVEEEAEVGERRAADPSPVPAEHVADEARPRRRGSARRSRRAPSATGCRACTGRTRRGTARRPAASGEALAAAPRCSGRSRARRSAARRRAANFQPQISA